MQGVYTRVLETNPEFGRLPLSLPLFPSGALLSPNSFLFLTSHPSAPLLLSVWPPFSFSGPSSLFLHPPTPKLVGYGCFETSYLL